MFVVVEEKADSRFGSTLLRGRGLYLLSEADPGCNSPVHTRRGEEREGHQAFGVHLRSGGWGELQWIQGAAYRGKMECGHLTTKQHKYVGEIIICNIKT